MSINLDLLCSEMINDIQKESDTITQQISIFYKENKDKKTVNSKFQQQIDDFLIKYDYTHAGLINTRTNEIISIDTKCSEKLNEVVNNLKNYIRNLDE
jgi:hypothetical protein